VCSYDGPFFISSVNSVGPDFNKIAGSDLDGDGYFVSDLTHPNLLQFIYMTCDRFTGEKNCVLDIK
jgi:hypothetical protein